MENQPAKVENQPLVGIERALGIEQLDSLHSTCKNLITRTQFEIQIG
jgi:hypothetical protein